MTLYEALENKEYFISDIDTDDEELDAFLFTLGCYSGEPVTVIAHRKGASIVSVKDGRYTFDKELCKAISLIA